MTNARIARAILTVGALTVVPAAALKLMWLEAGAMADARSLSAPHAARRLATYGDCSGLGVAYLERVLSVLPDPALLPLIRHRDPQPTPAFLLEGTRRRTDARVLVGIDVAPGEHAYAAELLGAPAPALPPGYSVIGGEGRCFTALRDDFLAEVRAGHDAQWLDALKRIRGAGAR